MSDDTGPAVDVERLSGAAALLTAHHQVTAWDLAVPAHSLVLTGAAAVVIDTGYASDTTWPDRLQSVLDGRAVRSIVVTHDDADHVGNLVQTLRSHSDASLLASGATARRLLFAGVDIAPHRLTVVDDGDITAVGNRRLLFLRPPLYDHPGALAVVDLDERCLWGGDLFSAPLMGEVVDADDVSDTELAEVFVRFHRANSPWYRQQAADAERFIRRLEELDLRLITTSHGPSFRGRAAVQRALALLRAVFRDR